MDGDQLVAALASAHDVFREIRVDDLVIETIDVGNGRSITPVKFDWSATVNTTGITVEIPCQVWIEWEGTRIVSYQEVFDREPLTRAMEAEVESRLEATASQRFELTRMEFEAADLPAAICGVVTREGRTEFVSLGTHGPDDDRPVDPDSIFNIASMTKAITSVAALQMVERGLIGLDDPLETILPELDGIQILLPNGSRRPATRPITLRDLLRHTGGFGYMFNSPQIMAEMTLDPSTGWPEPEVVDDEDFDWGFGIQPRRVFEAGTRWQYGRNLGVAGKMVERLSGDDLETYFQKNILRPLGMTRSGYNPPAGMLADRVQMHTRGLLTGRPMATPPLRPDRIDTFYGGGDMYSTPRDYATFLRCLLGGGEIDGVRILDADLVSLFMTDQLPEGIEVSLDPMPGAASDRRSSLDDHDDGYSLGWAIEVGGEDGLRPEGVGYWSGIFNTYYTVDPANGLAIVFFSQMQPYDDAGAYELYRRYEDEVYRAIR